MTAPMNGHAHPPRPLVVPPMQHPEWPVVSEVRRLALGPNDRLVIKLDAHLSDEIAQRLKELLGANCGIEPARVIVLGRGMDISVLEPSNEKTP